MESFYSKAKLYTSQLDERQRNMIYLALPVSVGGDSTDVDEFLVNHYGRVIEKNDLRYFCEQFRRWYIQGGWD